MSASELRTEKQLGRGTSPLDGVGIAHAFAEALARRRTFTFFATHFADLRKTLSFTTGTAFLHFEGEGFGGQNLSAWNQTCSRFRVFEGPAGQPARYGIELANNASLPRSVVAQARQVAQKLNQRQESARDSSAEQALAQRRSVLLELRKRLRQLATLSSLPDDELATSLRQIQRQCLLSLRKTMPATGPTET